MLDMVFLALGLGGFALMGAYVAKDGKKYRYMRAT